MIVCRVDARCALLYEWLRYRVLYVCDKVVIFWLKNTTGVLVFLTHTNTLVLVVHKKELCVTKKNFVPRHARAIHTHLYTYIQVHIYIHIEHVYTDQND